MPIRRYQIRAEYGSSDPELYRSADRDDPEAILEGVAMAGLVGVLRQLGDLAEFAAEIFHDLHEEVMATAARGHGLMLRVQQLEEEFPSIEKSFLSETNNSQVASSAGLDWHANLRMDQNLVASGDLPRFVMDSYEECRGPPRLFLLDKFDVAGAGASLKRYSDPSFFKMEFASSGKMKVDVPREKKVRKIKRKGMRYKIGDTPDFFSASEFSSRMRNMRVNEPHNVSGKSSMHGVKLKRRNLFDYSFNSIKRSYMEQIFKIHSPEQKSVYESSLVHSSWRRNSGDSSELHSEVYEIRPMDSAIKQTHMEHTDLVTMPSTTGKYGHELAREDSLCGPLELVNESETMDEIAIFPAFSPKDVVDGYKSDGNTSEMENFVDALTTMESELETDVENRLKHEKSILSFPIRGMDSDSIDEPVMLQAHLSDSQSVGNSSASYEWNKICKKKGSSPSSSDRLSNVEEPLPSAICYDKIHEPSFRRILTDGDTVEDNPSFLHVEYQNDILNLPVQVPNEASPGFCSGDSTSEHILTSPGLLDSPQTSSTFDEDHTVELLPSSGEVGQHLFVGSQNSSSMSSVIHSTVEDAQTLGFVGAAPGKEDPAKVSCDGDSEEKNKEILDLSRKLEGNISHDKSPASHFEDNVSANLVNSLSDPSVLLSEMTEYKQKLVERKPYVLLGKDASDQKHILHSSPHIAPISVKPHELDMVSIDDVFLSTKSEQSMNSLEKKQNISMIEFEEVPEQAVADFNSNPSIIKGKDSAPMLTATSAPIYVYEISSGPETVDSPLAQGNILKLDRCAVSEASVSLMHEKPENATANTHDTVGTDKTAVHFPPLQTDSDDCRPNFASTSVVSAGHNASSDECLRKITSYEHNLEMSELSSLESSSSFVNAVDSTIAFSPDTVVDQNKVEDVATPDAVKHEPDEFVIDRPLGGSTVMMPVTLNPDSDSEFVDFFSQPAAVGAYQSDVYQEEKEYLQHSGPFQAITYTPDAVPEQETGKGVSIGSSQEHSVVSETNEASPTCLQTLPKVFPEQESGAQRLESIKEVLESSQETGKILKCLEEICEVPNAVPSNQILEDHFDPICDIHFEDSVAEASYFLPQPVTDSEEGCQQSQKAAIADGSKVPHHDEIPVSSVETDQISGPHLSDEGPHTNLEGAGEIDQISELHMSDKDPHENVEDAIPPSVHLYQVTEQNVDNREIANSSLLNSETKQALAQIVFELSSSESLHEHVNPIMSASIGFQEVPEQTVDDSKAKSSDHESEIVQSLTQMTPGQLRQLESSDLFQGLESNMINKTEINCSPSPAESEACIYLPSCLNVSSSNGALSSSDRALPSLGLPDVQSATQQSSDLDEVPPLPPRPPVQWIEGKLSDESSSFWADAGSSLSFSPPPGLSEDSSSHGAQTSEDIFQSAKPIVTVPTTKEADNAGEGVISFNPFMPPLIDNGLTQDGLLGVGTLHPSNPFASLGFEEPPQGSISTGEASAPVVQLTQTTADEKPWQALNSLEEDVRQAVSPFASTLSEENERPRSRMVLPRRKDPLIEAVAAHDRSKLRKVSDRVKSEIKPKMDDRNSLLEQIRTKSFNLKPAGPTRPIIQGPKTNLNVAAILEKANAIRQALAGSDDDNDDDDSWSDSC